MGLMIFAGIILAVILMVKANINTGATYTPKSTDYSHKFGFGYSNIVLKSINNGKQISVLKEIREITGLGLKKAKDIIDSTPITFMTNINEYDATQIKNQLEDAGAVVDISNADNNLINITEVESNQELGNDIVNETVENDNITKIKQLAELKEQGIITEEEFQNKKSELLNRI